MSDCWAALKVRRKLYTCLDCIRNKGYLLEVNSVLEVYYLLVYVFIL